jgi:hypothetical protein
VVFQIQMSEEVFKKVVSHAKEYGFVFPSSEIYDGLGAVYDYGQNGVELKTTCANIGGNLWCKCMRILLALMPLFLCTQKHGKLADI